MVKTDKDGRKYNDYTDGKTFWQFETISKGKIVSHIASHLILLFIWIKVVAGWDYLHFSDAEPIEIFMSYLAVGILTLVPILYWGMSYSKFKQLQKGISP